MSIKGFIFYCYSFFDRYLEDFFQKNAIFFQKRILKNILKSNQNTEFGLNYNFRTLNTDNYSTQIPVFDYESMNIYLSKIKNGSQNISCSSKIIYLLKTSGTTSGVKYIPITKKDINRQINSAKKVLTHYVFHSKKYSFISNKMIFLQGSPILDFSTAIPNTRLSGVVYHHVPYFFQKNKLPSYNINILNDWTEKINRIVEESIKENLSVLAGIPPWCLQYLELVKRAMKNKTVKDIFPNLELYIHGGVNFEPYKVIFDSILPSKTIYLDTYPASEGFFAFEDYKYKNHLKLLVNNGIYFEFIPIDIINESFPQCLTLQNISIDKKYEMVITNSSGLYRYRTGDLVEFKSLKPFLLKVVGRSSQYISAFGEHVIAQDIDNSIVEFSKIIELKILDYFVSADLKNKRYVWIIEFETSKKLNFNIATLKTLDSILSNQNIYYKDLITGKIINNSLIIQIEKGTLYNYRKSIFKVGEQHKIVRLANDYIEMEKILSFIENSKL